MLPHKWIADIIRLWKRENHLVIVRHGCLMLYHNYGLKPVKGVENKGTVRYPKNTEYIRVSHNNN